MSASRTPQILIVGPSWVGDMVMAQSLFKTLRQKHPECLIDVLASEWALPLVARMPEVRSGIIMPVGHGQLGLRTRYRLGREYGRLGYDQAIVLPRTFKSALTPLFAHIPLRTGFRGEMRYGLINDMRPLNKLILTQTVQRFVALGLPANADLPPTEIPKPTLQIDKQNQQRLITKLGLSLSEPVIAVMPGAEYGQSKQWPADYYAQLVQQLHVDGYQIWLFGSNNDVQTGEEVARLSNGVVTNLCGKTALEDVVDLLSLAELAVTNDSGLMHIAAAVQLPVIVMYGASSPGYTPPLSDKAKILYLNLDCSPCMQRTCRYGHYNCLRDISVSRVLQDVRDQCVLSQH